jgi:hypothetical protein
LERLRAVRAGSPDAAVTVAALDDPPLDIDVASIFAAPAAQPSPSPDQLWSIADHRDVVMADRLCVARRGFTVALVGNVHASVGHDGPGGYVPMGWHIAGRVPSTVALLGTHSGGTYWAITDPDAGGAVQRATATAMTSPGAQWRAEPDGRGYHGTVHVGPITASLPHAP